MSTDEERRHKNHPQHPLSAATICGSLFIDAYDWGGIGAYHETTGIRYPRGQAATSAAEISGVYFPNAL